MKRVIAIVLLASVCMMHGTQVKPAQPLIKATCSVPGCWVFA